MTQTNKHFWENPVTKVCIISILSLLMLIPLALIRGQVYDREGRHKSSIYDITDSWGHSQTFCGPQLSYEYQKETGEENKTRTFRETLYPDDLRYTVTSTSQVLHRSVYDVPVYTADLTITGSFILDQRMASIRSGKMILCLDDLKGIQGEPSFTLGGKELKIKASEEGIEAEIALADEASEGDVLPFQLALKINGSESLSFRPVGRLTEVEMTSDCPNPSFNGDFLPTQRDVRPDGFTASWSISQITMADPTENSFGVRMVETVTQYRQNERAVKYGLLIIFLVFIAGFVVEMVSKKPINLIQYMVIGASLVLFYALLLAFSDFLSFGLSYLIASVMTTAALGWYFAGIVKSKMAWLLTALVAAAYGIIYILLQMDTFAFLAGTLLLFVILCVIMSLTKKLNLSEE